MSILDIGDKSNPFSRNSFLQRNEIHELDFIKRQKQRRYRYELEKQMRQKNERLHRQRQREIQLDLKYEQMFYEGIANRNKRSKVSRFRTEPKEAKINHEYQSRDTYDEPNTDKPKRKQWLPTLQSSAKESQILNKHNPEESEFPFRLASRLFTDSTYNRWHAYKWSQFIEDPEIRLQKMRKFENKKIDQVYDLMEKSVKVLNQSDLLDFETIRPYVKPIPKEIASKNRFQLKKRNFSRSDDQQGQFYRLPKVHNSFKLKYENNPMGEDQISWREWYARQKLKQLESVYQKQLRKEQIRSRMEDQNYRFSPSHYRQNSNF